VPAEVVATTPAGHDTHLVEAILTVATGDGEPCRYSCGSIAINRRGDWDAVTACSVHIRICAVEGASFSCEERVTFAALGIWIRGAASSARQRGVMKLAV
jgi:hypothetical protein